MSRLILHPSAFILPTLLLLAGCGSPPNNSAYIDPNGQRMEVDVNRANFQDFDMAAKAAVQSLLNKGVLKEKHPGQPIYVAIGSFSNDTDQQFNTNMFLSDVRIPLLDTGKVQILIPNSSGPVPDYVLSGTIMYDKTGTANIKQSAYFFDISLSDAATNAIIWEAKPSVVKQGTGSKIGL